MAFPSCPKHAAAMVAGAAPAGYRKCRNPGPDGPALAAAALNMGRPVAAASALPAGVPVSAQT
jgi:hypothetical protein